MARVVHRRKSPPYLLIVFVFLFLIASALGVIALNKYSDAAKSEEKLKEMMHILAGKPDREGRYPELRSGLASKLYDDRREEYDAAKKKFAQTQRRQDMPEVPVPVLLDLVNRNKKLRDLISSRAVSAAKAEDVVKDVRKKVDREYAFRTLVEIIEEDQKKIKEAQKGLGDKKNEVDRIEAERKRFEALANDLQDKLQKLTDTKAQEVAAIDNQYKAFKEMQDKKFEEAENKWADNVKEKDKLAEKLTVEKAKLTKERNEFKTKYETEKLRARPRPKAPKAVSPALQPDGKILRVLRGTDICYIDIGSHDRVIPGLTFGVYPPGTGPHTETPSKGNITVTRVVDDGLSQCRIDKVEDKDKPIQAGDNIANVAFDAVRTYVFVVEGQFDLFGAGQPGGMGSKNVKNLIKKFRGAVADELTPQTDFVVMGEPPARPTQPKAGAPESEMVVYEQQMKVYNRYQEIQTKAAGLRVPVLNGNRFLGLVGYVPKRRLD